MSESELKSGVEPGTKTSPVASPVIQAKPKRDKVKVAFVIVVLALLVMVWYLQRQSPRNLDWSQDLPQAMEKAKAQSRLVLVLVTASTPGEDDRKMNDITLAKKDNKKVLEEKFITTKVIVPQSMDDAFAREHKIKKLPTWLIWDSKGNELNRREGFIGEIPFRSGFLDLKEVVKSDK